MRTDYCYSFVVVVLQQLSHSKVTLAYNGFVNEEVIFHEVYPGHDFVHFGLNIVWRFVAGLTKI